MRLARVAACALASLASLAVPRAARADDAEAFELAKNPFDAGQYGKAHERFSALLDTSLPPCDVLPMARCHLTNADLIERARAFDAASLLALGRQPEADAMIAATLRQNPDYMPSPAMFPQELIDRFTMVRGAMAAELRAISEQRMRDEAAKRAAKQKAREAEQKWIDELERLASKERWVESNSRWVALIPFGVGQFQNGDLRLGITFAVSEALLGGTSLISVAVANRLATVATSGTSSPTDAQRAQINAAVLVNRISFAGWGTVMLAGILQAELAFVPQKVTYHDRPIPPRPKLAPVAAPLPGGAMIGLAGTF